MARAWVSLPVVVAAIGVGWVGYLGYHIWSQPQPGRDTQAALVAALSEAVTTRNTSELRDLFDEDPSADYADALLDQIPAEDRVAVSASNDAIGPVLILRVDGASGSRCTSWRTTTSPGRTSLLAGPAVTLPCS